MCSCSAVEFWLHPDRFKTSLCNQGPTCDRPICFFAHKVCNTTGTRTVIPIRTNAFACVAVWLLMGGGSRSWVDASCGGHHDDHIQRCCCVICHQVLCLFPLYCDKCILLFCGCCRPRKSGVWLMGWKQQVQMIMCTQQQLQHQSLMPHMMPHRHHHRHHRRLEHTAWQQQRQGQLVWASCRTTQS